MSAEERPRRHPNLSEKQALRAAQLTRHVRAASRKAQKRAEPNDRKDDPELAKKVKRIRPEGSDRLLRDGEFE